jgi:hypothetical protein
MFTGLQGANDNTTKNKNKKLGYALTQSSSLTLSLFP